MPTRTTYSGGHLALWWDHDLPGGVELIAQGSDSPNRSRGSSDERNSHSLDSQAFLSVELVPVVKPEKRGSEVNRHGQIFDHYWAELEFRGYPSYRQRKISFEFPPNLKLGSGLSRAYLTPYWSEVCLGKSEGFEKTI